MNSESMNDLTEMKVNRCDSSWELLDNSGGRATPPGTPPPPYPSPYQERSPSMSHRRMGGGGSERNSGDQSDDIHDEPPPAFTETIPETLPLLPDLPVVTSTPITAAISNLAQKQIMSMEDESSDQEVVCY